MANLDGRVRLDWVQLAKQTISEWQKDKASRLAAALAYYTLFSIAPLLIVVIAIAGLFFGRQAIQGQIFGQINGLVGDQGARLIQAMVANASNPRSGIVATIIGLVTLLLGAAAVFGHLKESLNAIWEVTRRPGGGILSTLKERFLSFAMLLGVGFLLMVSLVASAFVSALGQFFTQLGGSTQLIAWIVNVLVSFGMITLLFAMIYRYLPDVEIGWRDVWIGAAMTTGLFILGKELIGLYLAASSTASVYGAAGSLIIILLWIYYSAQIFFLGAEFTQVYARLTRGVIHPSEQAISFRPRVATRSGGAGPASTGAGRGKESAAPRPPLRPVKVETEKILVRPSPLAVATLLSMAIGAISGMVVNNQAGGGKKRQD